jgi:hypothetical protein
MSLAGTINAFFLLHRYAGGALLAPVLTCGSWVIAQIL